MVIKKVSWILTENGVSIDQALSGAKGMKAHQE